MKQANRSFLSTAVFALSILALCGTGVAAEEEVAVKEKVVIEEEESALAKQAQNPLANLVSLPLQFNFNDGVDAIPVAGVDIPDGRRMFNLNVQPVIPFSREKWNIISRTIIPVNSVPQGENDSVFGLRYR